jgi:hypothetical protein
MKRAGPEAGVDDGREPLALARLIVYARDRGSPMLP